MVKVQKMQYLYDVTGNAPRATGRQRRTTLEQKAAGAALLSCRVSSAQGTEALPAQPRQTFPARHGHCGKPRRVPRLSFKLGTELQWPPWMNSVKGQDTFITRQLPREGRLLDRADARLQVRE